MTGSISEWPGGSCRMLPTPDGRLLEVEIQGRAHDVPGGRTTVFAHGLGDQFRELKPLAGAVAGARAFFHFGGHGRSSTDAQPLCYAKLVDELLLVAAFSSATRAVGVSLGAGAVLSALQAHPGRFERAVLILPATVDRRGPAEAYAWFAKLADLVDAGDLQAVAGALARICPPVPDPAAACRARAQLLIDGGFGPRLRTVGGLYPVTDHADLAVVTVPVLVIAHRHDLAHSVEAAERLAALLPNAELRVFGERAVMASERHLVRAALGEFLNDPASGTVPTTYRAEAPAYLEETPQ